MTSAPRTQRFPRWIVVAPLISVGLIALLLTPWAISLIDPVTTPDKCAFNSVTEGEYQQLLVQAKAQRWTVWPDLSNGLIWPSLQPPKDRDPHPGYMPQYLPKRHTATYGPAADEILLGFINKLVGAESPSADRELASAHALMRSIGAELVHVFDIPDSRARSHVRFSYFLPQRRFAPLCLFCWLLPHTTVDIVFSRTVATGIITLDRVEVRHEALDGRITKVPNVSGPCPAFPPPRTGR